jgi:hypothetical protein
LALAFSLMVLGGCQTLGLSTQIQTSDAINLPFIKNTANECYFLDEFMPAPDAMVRGRSGALNLRYYSYRTANYKEWNDQSLILSFYSQDMKCWSLFEEYLVVR